MRQSEKKPMKSIVCFIDDSEFEHDLVKHEIAPAAPDWYFLQAYTYEETRARLGPDIPTLFLLDLWGKDETVTHPHIVTKEEMEEKILKIPTLDQVYEGLPGLKGDIQNEFLKRFFSIVEGWRSLFEEASRCIGQNRKYGLSNLDQARKQYPDVPAVFYTRKSMINDAVEILKHGADGLFIKPTGRNDAEIRRHTREYAPYLVKELRRIIAA